MGVYVSYDEGGLGGESSGYDQALAVAESLREHGIDAWWLPDDMDLLELRDATQRALSACHRCIVVWSDPQPSRRQIQEIEGFRARLEARTPPADSTDYFLVLRNAERLSDAQQILPWLPYSEHLDYRPSQHEMPDWSFLSGYYPGVQQLSISAGHEVDIDRPLEFPGVGRVTAITGTILAETGDQLPADEGPLRFGWMFLEDHHGNWYLQQPPPTFTHDRRWIAPAVHVGEQITAVVLAAADPPAHQQMVHRVLAGGFAAFQPGSIDGLNEIARFDF